MGFEEHGFGEKPPVRSASRGAGMLWIFLVILVILVIPILLVLAIGAYWTLDRSPSAATVAVEDAIAEPTVEQFAVEQEAGFAKNPYFAARLKAAKMITDPRERDQALVKLCQKNAADISAEAAGEALEAIGDVRQRNQTAAEIAIAMAQLGNPAALEIVNQVSDPQQRSETAESVAREAAQAGAAKTAVAALAAIPDPSRRGKVAYDVAQILSENRDVERAIEAAQQIGDRAKRNETLRHIAAGEWP